MRIRLILVGLELLGLIFGLIALLEFGWKMPQTAPFWPTVGYTFAFIGIALGTLVIMLFTMFWRDRK